MALSPFLYDVNVIKTLKSYADLIRFRSLLKIERPNQKVVVTNGCFDILHAGHIAMLEAARSFGDILIVGLNSDASIRQLKGPTRPINNQENRKKVLEAVKYVDFVQVFDDVRATLFLQASEPDVYVKSKDYNLDSMNADEKRVLENLPNVPENKFVDLIPNLSTTKIVKALWCSVFFLTHAAE